MGLTLEDAFLADIVACPADDAPRLVFADWLEDHGEPDRAEFIRLQVRRAGLPAADSRHGPLASREGTLLLAHENAWRAHLPVLEGVTWEDFSRGFVEGAFVESVDVFLQHADTLFNVAPIRRLQIGQVAASDARRLVQTPWLAQLRELNLGNNPALGRAGVRVLVGCPHLANLEVLLLHYAALGDDAIGDLTASPHLGNLTELYLSGNELGDPGAVSLGFSLAFPRLRDLDLRDNRIGDAGIRALTFHEMRNALETLWLVNNQIGSAGAWALAGTPQLPRLTRLYLNYNPIGSDGAIAFASSPHRRALRDLDLRNCGIRDQGARALVDSANLGEVEWLWLGGNRLRIETIGQLRRHFGERLRM